MVEISDVKNDSIASDKGILPGDFLVSVNSHTIEDVLDYQFYMSEKHLRIVLKRNSVYRIISVFKKEYEDIGLIFSDYLMSKQQHCKNKCIFCFIDQLPKGLRKSLYFKDDDSRLSFLFGNYITLTNLTQRDVDRIKEMHISPINISVHTTNPELRVKMMGNPNAGSSLRIIKELADSGIKINAQLVLCRGINDGNELIRTLNDLSALFPAVQMVAAVPLGVTKFREGLAQLTPYNKESSKEVLDIIENFADSFYNKNGTHFAYAADEFYLKSETKIPPAEYYEDFSQLENGVGMCALFENEFNIALENTSYSTYKHNQIISAACGEAAYKLISSLCKKAEDKYGITVNVYPIINDFFGNTITVSGLVTGSDIVNHLRNKNLGEALLLPITMLRKEEDLFLDDYTPEKIANELNTDVIFCENNGEAFLEALINLRGKKHVKSSCCNSRQT